MWIRHRFSHDSHSAKLSGINSSQKTIEFVNTLAKHPAGIILYLNTQQQPLRRTKPIRERTRSSLLYKIWDETSCFLFSHRCYSPDANVQPCWTFNLSFSGFSLKFKPLFYYLPWQDFKRLEMCCMQLTRSANKTVRFQHICLH